jgi:prophage regulatory protein
METEMPQPENLSTPFWEKIDPAGRMLRIRDVVHLTGLSRSQIYALIAEGRFPPLVKLSTRASAVPEAWLNAYLRVCAGRDVCATDLHGEDA